MVRRARARRWLAGAGAVVLTMLVAAPEPAAAPPPELWLWAWEHPQDLRFLDEDIGVAFLATTLHLSREGVDEQMRRQPLQVRQEQRLVAVVRIEYDGGDPVSLDASAQADIVATVRRVASMPGVGGVQIDFDAVQSQRAGYVALLRALRAALPTPTSLSMTALASWCEGDGWIDDAVDEVVPMLFEMGPDAAAVRHAIDRRGSLRSPRCRRSVGHMVGRPWIEVDEPERVYVFRAGSWTREAVDAVRERIG